MAASLGTSLELMLKTHHQEQILLSFDESRILWSIKMNRILFAGFTIFLFILITSSCASKPDPEKEKSEIREAILNYLASTKNVKTDQMDVTIDHLDLQENTASCSATFVLRSVEGMPPISYQYKLHKTSDQWKVDSSEPLSSHGKAEGE